MANVVIGIAGAPGSGKSSVAWALAAALGEACVVQMDSYERMTRQSMEEIAAWAARGADVNELPVPLLGEHLAALKGGRAVTDPATGATIQPAPWILFETQFGRDHRASGQHIDLLVWLDTPREIALARTLRKLADDALAAPASELRSRMTWISGYLGNYLGLVQRLVANQRERVLPGADLVVDGAGSLEGIVGGLRQQIAGRVGGSP